MTDNEIRAAAVGIIAYQSILNSGKTPAVVNKTADVTIDADSYEAFCEAIRFCGKSKIDNAQISFYGCKGGAVS